MPSHLETKTTYKFLQKITRFLTQTTGNVIHNGIVCLMSCLTTWCWCLQQGTCPMQLVLFSTVDISFYILYGTKTVFLNSKRATLNQTFVYHTVGRKGLSLSGPILSFEYIKNIYIVYNGLDNLPWTSVILDSNTILRIISRNVAGLATDFPCRVWGRWRTTCLLYGGPLLGTCF